jgi:hypothetical protein
MEMVMDDYSLMKFCCLCGRQGTRGYQPYPRTVTEVICSNEAACAKRIYWSIRRGY